MAHPNDKVGPYILVSKLGRGAFGVVWMAEKRTSITTTRFALKLPRDGDIDLEAIRQEAAVWVEASGHPNVLPIIEADIYDEQVVIVSEYAPDGSLAAWLERHGGKAPSVEAAVEMVVEILAGLEHLHKRRIIHRDLKPDNILLQGETPRLADFGIARLLKSSSQSSNVSGTLPYMAPEAFDGKRNEQTDVWSVGVIFYQLVAGRLPFPQSDMASLVGAIMRFEPAPLPFTIPKPVQMVIARALQKEPERRYTSATEMRRALREAARALELNGGDAETLHDSEAHFDDPSLKDHKRKSEPIYLDENVQFTVYRPKTVEPRKWYALLAFAHLAERRPDAREDEPNPIEVVRKQARQALGERAADYLNITQDSRQGIPREGEITFVPDIPGIEFNPPSRSFLWLEDVHQEEFRLRASGTVDGRMARGQLTVFLGGILIAEIPLSIRVDSKQVFDLQTLPVATASSQPFRKIFASYSHRDREVAEQFRHYAEALGDRYLINVASLRAGDKRDHRVEQLIDDADVFQLFWSRNSMDSPFVKREWEYALSLGRPNFVRPTYWETPLPARPEMNLPPEELRRLHFQQIKPVASTSSPLQETAPYSEPMILRRVEAEAENAAPPFAKVEEQARQAAAPSHVQPMIIPTNSRPAQTASPSVLTSPKSARPLMVILGIAALLALVALIGLVAYYRSQTPAANPDELRNRSNPAINSTLSNRSNQSLNSSIDSKNSNAAVANSNAPVINNNTNKPTTDSNTGLPDANSNLSPVNANDADTSESDQRGRRNFTPLRVSDEPNGSRVTVTADEALNDYSAYRSGDRFYVVIPNSNKPQMPSNLRGRGFSDPQVQKRGRDTVFSFRLESGANARIDQRFNRLEIIFTKLKN